MVKKQLFKLFSVISAIALFSPLFTSAQNAAVSNSVKLSGNSRYLITDSKQPFFYLGDTAWLLFERLTREDADKYLKNRAAKGFNVIQATLLAEFVGKNGNAYGHRPLVKNDPTKPDIKPGANNDFWDHADYIINKADSLGLYMGILPTWGDKVTVKNGAGPLIFNNETRAYTYGHFLGTRYKNKRNIIWILGGDRNGGGDYKRIWRAMAEGIADGVNGINKQDGKAHYSTTCMTYHPENGNISNIWFRYDDWLDFHSYQSGHALYNEANNYNIPSRNYDKAPVKPIIDIEPNYEDHPVAWNPSNGWFNDYDVRKTAYWTVFSGCAGYTYGAHGIWQMFSPGQAPISSCRTYWYDSLDFPGAFQMVHLKNLMLSRPYFSRIPDQNIIDSEGEGGNRVQAARSTDGAYALVYFPKATQSHIIKAGKLSGSKINAWWYNPRDGKCYTQDGRETAKPFETFAKADRSFDPPGTDENTDWILVLDDSFKGFTIPGKLPAKVEIDNSKPLPVNPKSADNPDPTILDRDKWDVAAMYNGSESEFAIDANESTEWYSINKMKNGMWFRVDLGSVQDFDKIELKNSPDSKNYPKSYEVYVSNNGVDWVNKIANGTGSPVTIINFTPRKARYIRIVQTGKDKDNEWRIGELYIYNTKAG